MPYLSWLMTLLLYWPACTVQRAVQGRALMADLKATHGTVQGNLPGVWGQCGGQHCRPVSAVGTLLKECKKGDVGKCSPESSSGGVSRMQGTPAGVWQPHMQHVQRHSWLTHNFN